MTYGGLVYGCGMCLSKRWLIRSEGLESDVSGTIGMRHRQDQSKESCTESQRRSSKLYECKEGSKIGDSVMLTWRH